jgi:hypothetical protein
MQFESRIDSLAKPDATEKKRYVLLPGNKDVEATDLQFLEYAGYVEKVLSDKGFVRSSSFDDSDVAVVMAYAIGDPQTHHHTYSVPIWGKTGVSSSQTYGTVTSFGGSASYSGTTTYTPTYGITGYSTNVASQTTYTRFLVLDAYDIAVYKRDKRIEQVWTTRVVSTGSSDDLLRIQ